MLIAPPRLQQGDKIALVSPSRWPTPAHAQGIVGALERNGFVPVQHPQFLLQAHAADGRLGQLAGDDDARAAALNEVLNDPEIKGVFFGRAGAGSYRILDKVDYQAAMRHPKIIVGFSDLDILLHTISDRSGIVTFRGPLGVNYADPNMDPRTESECFELLTGKRNAWHWSGATVLREGSAEGALVGGNLAVLNANIGTPYEVDTDGKIVVVEEVDELLYRLDRFLYQASKAGKFAHAKAVLFGTVENMLDGEQHDGSGNVFGKTVPEMLRDFIPGDIPVAFGLPLGHGSYLSSHPIGASVHVDIAGDAVKMKLLNPVVS